MSNQPGYISSHRYGKDLVKVLRVVRDKQNGKEIHHCIEYTVRGKHQLELNFISRSAQCDKLTCSSPRR